MTLRPTPPATPAKRGPWSSPSLTRLDTRDARNSPDPIIPDGPGTSGS